MFLDLSEFILKLDYSKRKNINQVRNSNKLFSLTATSNANLFFLNLHLKIQVLLHMGDIYDNRRVISFYPFRPYSAHFLLSPSKFFEKLRLMFLMYEIFVCHFILEEFS